MEALQALSILVLFAAIIGLALIILVKVSDMLINKEIREQLKNQENK